MTLEKRMARSVFLPASANSLARVNRAIGSAPQVPVASN